MNTIVYKLATILTHIHIFAINFNSDIMFKMLNETCFFDGIIFKSDKNDEHPLDFFFNFSYIFL